MSQRIDPESGSDSPVSVERGVNRKPEGVTVTYHFTGLTSEPVGVRVVQPLAGEQAVRDVGFHPEHEPTAWTQSDDAVVFDAVVDGETEVVLGVAGDRDRALPADTDARVETLERDVDADATDFLFGDPFPGSSWLDGVRRALLGGDGPETPDVPIVDRDAGGDGTDGGITVESADNPDAGDSAVDWSGLQPAVEPVEDADDIVIETADDERTEVTDLADAEADTEAEAAESTDDEADAPSVADAEADRPLVDAVKRVDESPDESTAGDTDAPGETEPVEADVDAAEDEAPATESGTDESEGGGEPAVETDPEAVDAESASVSPEQDTEPAHAADDTAGPEPVAADGSEPAVSADVAARLAAELEAGEVDEETLDALRERLQAAEDATDVRLRHVQSRMSDFEAYADALEDVIEAHGTASPFMEETAAHLDSLDDEIAAIEGRVAAEAEEREALGERVESQVEAVEERVDGEIEAVEERVDDEIEAVEERVDGEIEAVEERVNDVDADVSSVQGSVDDVAAEVDDLRESLTDVEHEVSELRSTHETRFRRLEDDVNMLATDVREMREDLQSEVAELEEELAEMRSFRENLSAAFDTGGE